MKSKLHKFKNITFTFPGGKWAFTNIDKHYTFLTKCQGGQKTAEKVARQIFGSFARSGTVDGLAKSQIDKITHFTCCDEEN
jgi:hypothetical protein